MILSHHHHLAWIVLFLGNVSHSLGNISSGAWGKLIGMRLVKMQPLRYFFQLPWLVPQRKAQRKEGGYKLTHSVCHWNATFSQGSKILPWKTAPPTLSHPAKFLSHGKALPVRRVTQVQVSEEGPERAQGTFWRPFWRRLGELGAQSRAFRALAHLSWLGALTPASASRPRPRSSAPTGRIVTFYDSGKNCNLPHEPAPPCT